MLRALRWFWNHTRRFMITFIWRLFCINILLLIVIICELAILLLLLMSVWVLIVAKYLLSLSIVSISWLINSKWLFKDFTRGVKVTVRSTTATTLTRLLTFGIIARKEWILKRHFFKFTVPNILTQTVSLFIDFLLIVKSHSILITLVHFNMISFDSILWWPLTRIWSDTFRMIALILFNHNYFICIYLVFDCWYSRCLWSY